MLSFLYVYSDHPILECYNLFSGVELSMRSFFVIFEFLLNNFGKLTNILSEEYPTSALFKSVLSLHLLYVLFKL